MNPIKLKGILILATISLVGCYEAKHRTTKDIKAKWKSDLLEQKSKTEKVIAESKKRCNGKFTVRYVLDGWIRELEMPEHWECEEDVRR